MHSHPRIAIFLATSGHSGVERVMGNLIKGLGRLDIRVDLLRIKGHGPYLTEIPKNIRIITFDTKHVYSALPPLVRYLKDKCPDALLTDKDRVNRVAILARLISGANTRVVVRVGTTVSENLRRRPFLSRRSQLLSIRLLYPLAQAVLVPSQGAREDLISIAPKLKAKVFAVKSPIVDAALFRRAKEPVDHPWLGDSERPLILGAGELCERKDFSTLIKAFHILRKEVDARLIILGKGKKRSELLDLAGRLEVSDFLDLPGFVKNPLPFMRQADCFCLTSRCEGMPVVLIEALAMGTPVCSTDCPSGPRELLQDGRMGRLVAIGDYEALSRAISETLKAPPPRHLLRRSIKGFTVKNGTLAYLRHLLPNYSRP